ncbi:MAG: hypothetical protein GF364_13720 [Candidatus Lokiarchaeota archaeon]|nr:hypothetical protein [Candidatus Lokiarchaeota archaeon]
MPSIFEKKMCPKCGKSLARRATCPKCGKVNILRCSECKKRIEACEYCGTLLR